MQISRDSWHYRIVAKQFRRESSVPANLCPYMRALVKGMGKTALKYIGLALLCILGATIGLAPLVYAANLVFDFLPTAWLLNTPENIHPFMLFTIIGTALYMLCAAFGGLYFGKGKYDDFKYARRQKRADNPLPPREPGIFATWWKDFHDKTCTSLEFVEPQTPEAA